MSQTQTVETEDIKVLTEEDLFKLLTRKTFKVYFKNKYKVQEGFVLEANLERARDKMEAYCERFKMRFIAIHPFFINLDQQPAVDEG